MNAADEWTEKQLQALERRMAKEYRQASKEMKAKLDKHLSDYQREKPQRLKALDDTPEARAEYKRWLESQTARAAWMNDMVADLSQHAVNARQEAFRMVAEAMPGIFAENANRAAFEVDRAAKVDTRFTLMDEGTVKVLMLENPRLLPEPSVNVPKDQRWNKQKLASAITQGVLQGESIPDIAKRVQTVANMGYHSACGTARLAVTCAENAGRVSSYERARDMGIELRQEWLATHDNRTRHSHRQLDGEKVEVGGMFSNGCRFPGDPDGPASEIYGCRCTLVADVEGIDTSDAERWSKLEGMTYEEWKNNRALMSSPDGKVEWPETAPRLNAAKYSELSEYAKERNVGLHSTFENAMVDERVARRMIDAVDHAISTVPELLEVGGKRPITLMLDSGMDADDFAKVMPGKPWLIHLNAAAMRDEVKLAAEYDKAAGDGWFVRGTTYEAIVYHELGHVYQKCYNIDARKIARNLLGTSDDGVLAILLEEQLSGYASHKPDTEIVSEVMAAWLSKIGNSFSIRFMAEARKR